MKFIKYVRNSLHLLVNFVDKIYQNLKGEKLRHLREISLKENIEHNIFSIKLSYEAQKFYYINSLAFQEPILEIFQKKQVLPQRYGSRFDERVVEYPWVVSRLTNKPSRLLDAGSALNHRFLLENALLARKSLDIITLAPEPNCFWNRKISYFFSDLRYLPIRDAYYDEIACISTLEHIGMNNEAYDPCQKDKALEPISFQIALQELKRVLKPNGTLLITVPFGKPTSINWLQQFGVEEISFIKNLFKGSFIDITYYKYQENGWQISSQEECIDCEYLDPGIVQASNFNQMHFIAPTATAIACLAIKPRLDLIQEISS